MIRLVPKLSRSHALPWLLCAFLALCGSGAIAGSVDPPLHMLFSGKNRLIIGEVAEINPPNRIVFHREKVFGAHDDVPELIDLLADESALSLVSLGERCVVAYSFVHRDKRQPGGYAFDSKAAIVLTSTGIEPALFKDSPTLERILSASDSEPKRDSRELLDLLLKTLDAKDSALGYLAAAQIALDADLGKQLNEKEKTRLHQIVLDTREDTPTRRVLMQASFLFPTLYGDWWQPAAKEVLATTPVGGYPQGPLDPTGLVLLAFGVVEGPDVSIPLETITRWLGSSNPLFRERASALLGSKFPGQEESAIKTALRNRSLDPDARSYLDDQLRRIERHGAEQGTQQQGPG